MILKYIKGVRCSKLYHDLYTLNFGHDIVSDTNYSVLFLIVINTDCKQISSREVYVNVCEM